MNSQSQWPEIFQSLGRLRRCSDGANAKLARLGDLLLDASQHFNVTSLRNPHSIAIGHFEDSLAALDAEPGIGGYSAAADLGSGGGFPLFPLAIALTGSRWTAVESVRKKCEFIAGAAKELELYSRIAVYCGRAESLGREKGRGAFNLVTARAVGPVAALCEVGLPLLRIGGRLLLYKTAAALEEWQTALPAIKELGGAPMPEYRYWLPEDKQDRIIFRIEKVAPTPERYPRAPGIPFNRPLRS